MSADLLDYHLYLKSQEYLELNVSVQADKDGKTITLLELLTQLSAGGSNILTLVPL